MPVISNTIPSTRPTLSSSCSSHMSADRGPFGHCPKHVPATCPDQPSAQHLTPIPGSGDMELSRDGHSGQAHAQTTPPSHSAQFLNLPCFSPSSSPHLSYSRPLNILSRPYLHLALAVLPPTCSASRRLPRIPMDGLLLDTLTRLASEALASNLRPYRSKHKLT